MNILITGGGCPGFYSVYSLLVKWAAGRDLEERKKNRVHLFSCDMLDRNASKALPFIEEAFVVPAGNDPDYLSAMELVCSERSIDYIIPLTDPELLPLSKARTVGGAEVLCSEYSAISAVLDKVTLYRQLPEIAPKFVPATARVGMTHNAKPWMYSRPVLKASRSYGSRGVKIIVPRNEWLKAIATHKPESFGSLLPSDALEEVPDLEEYMLVENLPGSEYSIDCFFNSKGHLVITSVREREATRNGICSTAKIIRGDLGEYVSFAKTVAQLGCFRYIINIQAKRDSGGELKLLEVNPRIPGSIGSWFPRGINFLHIMMSHVVGGRDPYGEFPFNDWDEYSYRVSHFIG